MGAARALRRDRADGLDADPAASVSRSARSGRAPLRGGGRSAGDAGPPRDLGHSRRLEQRGSLRDGSAAAGECRAAAAFSLLTWSGSPRASSPRGSPTSAARNRCFSTCANRGSTKRRALRARRSCRCASCRRRSGRSPRTRRWWRSAITADAACRWRCSSKSRASSACTTSWGASMPGLAPSTRRFRFTENWGLENRGLTPVRLFWGLTPILFSFNAAAEDLMQVYRDAQRYDAVYAAAEDLVRAYRDPRANAPAPPAPRQPLAAGREPLPQGRALLLPTLN